MKPRLFLNYAREDRVRVKELRDALTEAGFDPWMDLECMPGGDQWRRAIEREITQSDFFIACLTAQSVLKRGVVRDEIDIALQFSRNLAEYDIFVVPIRLEQCTLPQKLHSFNCIDLFENSALPRLLKAILEGLHRRGRSVLRSTPDEFLLDGQVGVLFEALKEKRRNGVRHQFSITETNGVKLLEDYSTGLTWQYALSPAYLNFEAARRYVADMNENQYGKIDQWRLPTLDEAFSIGLCYYGTGMDASFSIEKGAFWTADTRGELRKYDGQTRGDVWVVSDGVVPQLYPAGQEVFARCVSSYAASEAAQQHVTRDAL